MKLKLDENLPATLAERLILLGHDADTVPQEDLAGEVAQRERRKLARLLRGHDRSKGSRPADLDTSTPRLE